MLVCFGQYTITQQEPLPQLVSRKLFWTGMVKCIQLDLSYSYSAGAFIRINLNVYELAVKSCCISFY